MAGPIQSATVVAPGPREAYSGPLGTLGWALSWLDYAIYSIEYIIVVIAMVAMTLIEFVYILSLYAVEQKIAWAQMQDPALNAEFPWSIVVLLGFVGLMMTSIVQNTRLGRTKDDGLRPLPVRAGLSVGLTALVAGFGGLTVWLEDSSTFYLILTSLIMLPSTWWFFQAGQRNKGYVMVGLTVLAYIGAWTVPEGYSWADKRALFLLLWVGFLGASMAAKQHRHLKIDIARKLCPDAWLPRFNGLSYTVAALFTAVLVYLGLIYLFHPDYGRFWVDTIEGEIPDWFKVASIPLALLLLTLRFGARGLGLLIWGRDSGLMPPDLADSLTGDAPHSGDTPDTNAAAASTAETGGTP